MCWEAARCPFQNVTSHTPPPPQCQSLGDKSCGTITPPPPPPRTPLPHAWLRQMILQSSARCLWLAPGVKSRCVDIDAKPTRLTAHLGGKKKCLKLLI